MTDVVIAGIGQNQVGEHWKLSCAELALTPFKDAVKDSAD